MARRPGRPRKNRKEIEEGAPGAGTNTFDPRLVEETVTKIENLGKELDTEKSEYMLRCKDVRSDIRIVYDEAKEAGITRAVLKAKIKERALRKKVANCRASLESEQIDMFDQISSALKDIFDDAPRAEFTPPSTAQQPFAPA